VIQSNARFGLNDLLEVHPEHVSIYDGKDRFMTKGRSLDLTSAMKRRIATAKEAVNCLVHARFTSMARVNGDTKYKP
jgi:hypothetical protein